MRSWWKTLVMVVSGLLGLAAAAPHARAQFPSPEGGGPQGHGGHGNGGHGHGHKGPPDDPFSMTVEGPNAFGDQMGIRARESGVFHGGPLQHVLPGFLRRRPVLAIPANFPNPAVASCEEASPFTMQEGGQSNGFTELCDPQPHPLLGRLGARRLLHTEFLEGPRADPYWITFRYEYLMWDITRTGPAVALVTTNPSFPAQQGALGQPNTQIIVPASNTLVDYQTMHGARLTTGINFGHYVPPIEVAMYSLGRTVTPFAEGSLDATGRLLARPVQFLNVPVAPNVGAERVIPINTPGVLAGSIAITSRVNFWSLDANFFIPLIDADRLRTDFILGYRHNGLYENFDITQTTGGRVGTVFLNGAALPPLFSVQAVDNFRTENTFNGGQFGFRNIFQLLGRFSVFSDAKLAIGNTYQQVRINGSTTLIQPVDGRPTQTFPGGVLALPSNSGTTTQNIISISPEVNAALSYQFNRNLRFYLGYNLTYWNNVVRPGDHISSIVDSRQIRVDPSFNANIRGIAPPFPAHVQRDFYARGVFFGLEMGF